jgi:hypothetical protein
MYQPTLTTPTYNLAGNEPRGIHKVDMKRGLSNYNDNSLKHPVSNLTVPFALHIYTKLFLNSLLVFISAMHSGVSPKMACNKIIV